jgi:hypothetical protein
MPGPWLPHNNATGPAAAPKARQAHAELSGPNSNDGATTIASVDLSVPRQITVATSTLNGSSGAGFLTQMFASALNAPPVTVGARATASFAPPGGATAFPLAISDCQYDLSGAEEAEERGEIQLIKYKPGSDTCTSTSGHVIPGGFGWLDESDTCVATTDADDFADTNTGADFPNTCTATVTAWRNTILAGCTVEATFPVYDDAGGTGHGGWFHIRGYATFNIIGWAFSGGGTPEVFRATMPWVEVPANACTGSCRGIIGQFMKYESIGDMEETPGSGPDLGTVNIRLIK